MQSCLILKNNTIMTIKDLFAEFDILGKKNLDEDTISSAIKKLTPDNKEDLSPELMAELMAFDFAENYQDNRSGWGTYFGPMMVWSKEDGTVTESPSIQLITPKMISYWEKRAMESKNPVLIARYIGLVWDFQRIICNTIPSHELCRLYIKSLVEIANGDYHKCEVNTYSKLERALGLAISLNDIVLIEECKNAIISFENRHSQDTKPGLWGYSFDLLVGNKKINLSNDEENEIIKKLENKLVRLTKSDSEDQKIDPWAAEAAAERLAVYYRKKQKNEEVRRVILEIGKAFDKIMDETSAMQASGWLDHLHKIYTKYNLKDEAEKLLLKLREIGPKVASELKPISHEFKLHEKKIEDYINSMISGSIEEVILRITIRYIPIKKQVKEQIFDLSKKAPFSFLISQKIQDEKGRVIATIGSLEDDLEGQIIRQVTQNLAFSSLFLRRILQKSVDKLNFRKESVMQFLKKTPIISKDRYVIIEKGLDAYFSKDDITAIHLIIPQIEEAIRNILEFAGGNVLKPSRGGGYKLRTFDEILRDKIINEALGEDFASYFRILFTDQRGWNMRNNVCHGMANPNSFNYQTSDRVLHALLCLGLIHEKTESTKV